MSRRTRNQRIQEALARHEAGLLRYVFRFTGDADRARDVVQDAFLKLCSQDETVFDRLAPWLYTVCRNRALDVRERERRTTAMSETSLLMLTSQEQCAASQIEDQDVAHGVLLALGALPERQQEVLRLKFQSDLSYKEIAEVTGLKIGYVGYLIHTGLKNLRLNMNATDDADCLRRAQ